MQTLPDRAGVKLFVEVRRDRSGEAARTLGLSYWQTARLVVLPQALKSVIAPMVTLAIGIFLDTTLVIIIGMFDFLNTARTAATDPNWLGFYAEAYALAAATYLGLSSIAARYSLWLEAHLNRSGHPQSRPQPERF